MNLNLNPAEVATAGSVICAPAAAFKIKTQELAAAYVSTRGPGSIIGDEVLDFQVRNGTGYFHFSIATSKVEC